MSQLLHRLFRAARSAGVRISPAEAIDACNAASLVGFTDRQALKDSLSFTLAKTVAEKELFSDCFDRYFRRDLIGGDADVTLAIEAAGEAVDVSAISFFTATNLYTRRILDQMGDQTGGGAALAPEIRAYVERQLALYAEGENRAWRERSLTTMRLGAMDRRDLARMQVIVRTLARRLATRLARRRHRARRGQLDARRTLRRNMPHDAIPFRTVWKRRRIDRPRVMALCDVSGSVANVARFMLLFLHVLAETLPDIRCFAFAGHLEDVSSLLDADADGAAQAVLDRIGGESSNYGRSLADFERGWLTKIDRKTSVIILGDARGNNTPPRLDIMRRIFERAGRVVWLNPEIETFWGIGDSDMPRYRPYCHQAAVCNTIRHLDRALSAMLET